VDETGVPRLQLLVADAEALGHAGAERLDQDIRGVDELAEPHGVALVMEIEDDAPLAPAEERERGLRPQGRAAGRFDPHDLCTVVREHLADLRPEPRRREVDDPQAFQCVHSDVPSAKSGARWPCQGGRRDQRAPSHPRRRRGWRLSTPSAEHGEGGCPQRVARALAALVERPLEASAAQMFGVMAIGLVPHWKVIPPPSGNGTGLAWPRVVDRRRGQLADGAFEPAGIRRRR
jgi:hypothetical protein